MKLKKSFFLLMSLLAITSCQHMELAEEVEEITSISVPTFTGEGTMEAPFTIEQFQTSEDWPDTCWIIGYAVGSTYRSISNANLANDGNYEGNILLAASKECKDAAICVPIELTSTSMQRDCSLMYHAENYGCAILIAGIPGRYFGLYGLRKAMAAKWLNGFDISTINPDPMTWEEKNRDYLIRK